MIPSKTLVSAAVALSAVLAVIAFLGRDWMWLVIDIVCVTLLVIPHVRELGYRYNRNIIAMSMVAPVVAVVVYAANNVYSLESEVIWQVNLYTYVTAGIQAYQCFLLGFMLSVVMDRSYGLTMTIPWMIVFALTFAMSLSALDMFFTFGLMYAEGFPVFNEDFFDNDRYTNPLLMSTPVASTFVTAVLAVLMSIRGRGKSKDFFIEEVSA
ncbi:hypothetical protein JS82_04700 [Methanomassiliicoccaceae archaeon DOK]|nr:hypothetical protein JS82_04700 [Methanomassiliicoccaceae archaeon DOK]